ncbi:S-adenosyl-L-methionine-dependent methyltransferase [Fimicolochytrium jonesii]|uniref:S-adenosyl-L-methionine-dependent methyltransferase n=1 Tax=Fimicolochytrium jonesii TaxID=1396493 RepID=UPI0022FE5F35|nr:S-adenosyl-L-methionine-dependent methyltransferase [Fimicolochytrium jonesii]KAI8818400.1 S-adenosyl-L-methionine-dependent methyltransferase [Fimicolochytrium jonesii]
MKHLCEEIKFKGPISVAEFMRSALTHPLGGYYMKGDVFGIAGDFTTSPEISQVFGELVGIWFITLWKQLGSPKDIQIVEMGPGRGTLMADMLGVNEKCSLCPRKASQADPIHGVHMVDASPGLQEVQAQKLAPNATLDKSTASIRRDDDITVHWHESLETVPEGMCTMFVAHEFFDAMPIFKFKLTKDGWREIVVGLDKSPDSQYHFCFTLADGPTKPSAIIMQYEKFQKNFKEDDRVEVSPDSYAVSNRIARRIQKNGGGALFVDYGRNYTVGDSLRGIRNHKFTDVLSKPGEADLSADVDFSFLRESTHGIAAAHGPITQSTFLRAMGIAPRMNMLLQNADAKTRKELATAFDRLVSPSQMGTVYKVMAITQEGVEVPYPFQDDPLMEKA